MGIFNYLCSMRSVSHALSKYIAQSHEISCFFPQYFLRFSVFYPFRIRFVSVSPQSWTIVMTEFPKPEMK